MPNITYTYTHTLKRKCSTDRYGKLMHHSIQVLSESVSKALQEVRGEEVAETAKFCLMMDRFFDSLNVTNYSEGYEKLKSYIEFTHISLDIIQMCSN